MHIINGNTVLDTTLNNIPSDFSNTTIQRDDPRNIQIVELLKASHALMESLFPPEENYYLSIDELCAPHIHMFSASVDNVVYGCAALAMVADYGELKSMFVAEAARGTGIADQLMNAIIDDAKSQSLAAVKLETGDKLVAACKLYARHGFIRCAPFGSYTANETSIFMQKLL